MPDSSIADRLEYTVWGKLVDMVVVLGQGHLGLLLALGVLVVLEVLEVLVVLEVQLLLVVLVVLEGLHYQVP